MRKGLETSSSINSVKVDKFSLLIKKIRNRDKSLAESFEENIEFVEFKDNTLIWKSKAKNLDKEILKRGWLIIRTFVQEIFGIDTKIVNIPSETSTDTDDSIEKIDEKCKNTTSTLFNKDLSPNSCSRFRRNDTYS